jgi:calcium/calmodulin-dependent protein kinase kinase 2
MLLSAEQNCANLVDPPNELEVNRAFNRKINHLFCVVRDPLELDPKSL